MHPAPFRYVAPTTLDEALDLLAEHGDDAKVMAGGQSLIPLLKLRFARPGLVVDLARVPGLRHLRDHDGGLEIGALVRHADLERSAAVADGFPVLAAAAPQIADPLVRNRGTLGGSLAHADPAGDLGSVMLALDATLVATGSGGERVLAAHEFFAGPFTTALQPTEILTAVRLPRHDGPSGGTYLKLERKVGDFATVGVATHLDLDDGTIARAGIALTAVGPQNVHCTEAEAALAGAEPTDEAFAEAAELAAAAADPATDVRGSAEYKRHMVRVYVRRGLARSLELARRAG